MCTCNVCNSSGLSRRGIFAAGVGALALAAAASGARAQSARSAETPDAAFARLMEGATQVSCSGFGQVMIDHM